MAKKKAQTVNMKTKNDNFVGTINVNELIANRAGKISGGTHQGLGTKIHKSKKAYDRKQGKKDLRNLCY